MKLKCKDEVNVVVEAFLRLCVCLTQTERA
jgi:hypothetical protein